METFYRFIFAPVALVAFIVSGCNFKCLIYYNFVQIQDGAKKMQVWKDQ